MNLTDPIRLTVSGEDPAALTAPAEIMRYRTPDGRLALQDQVAVVTGGASGIGFAAARALAANGTTVVISGRRERELREAAAMLRDSGAECCVADVTRSADVTALTGYVTGRFGRLDIAFNNAGFQEPRGLLAEQREEVYATAFDANVRSLFLCMRAQLNLMAAQGAGVIINNTSVSGVRNPTGPRALLRIESGRDLADQVDPAGVRRPRAYA